MSKLNELIRELCPDGVEYLTLGQLGKFFGGLTGKSKSDFTDGNAAFITYRNVYANPALDTTPTEKVKIAAGENQRTLEYGDVIFTGSSETPDECGISSVVTTKPHEALYLNSFCFIFRFDDLSIIEPDYAKHLFRSTELRCQIGKTASGVTRYNVSKDKMAKVVIPVPPIEVQREIVRILDKFTELSAELSAELSERKKQYEYYRHSLLAFGSDIPRIALGDIGKVCMCKRIMKAQTSSTGDVPFYKIGTFGKEPDAFISQELFEEYKQKYNYPKKGDILISAAGTIGRTVVFDGEPSYFQDSNIVWLQHDGTIVTNKYLRYCYAMSPWHISTGGTIARLYNDNITKAVIPVPPLEEQERIVTLLDRFDTLCNDLSSGLPAEIEARRKQYEYYRDKLLTFKPLA